MRWLIPVAGTVLAATDKLTTWWGIAIIVVLALIHFMDALSGADVEAQEVSGEPDVYEFLKFLVITLPMVAGVFVGNAVADAVGAAIGSVGLGLLGSAVWTVLHHRTERQIAERDSLDPTD